MPGARPILYSALRGLLLSANSHGRGRIDSAEWEAEDARVLLDALDALWRTYLGEPGTTQT